jgi:hypothetical protein
LNGSRAFKNHSNNQCGKPSSTKPTRVDDGAEKNFICHFKFCKSKFSTSEKLESHVWEIHDKIYTCPACSRSLKGIRAINKHTGICSEKTIDIPKMVRHENVRAGMCRYGCFSNKNVRKFENEEELKKHIWIDHEKA